MELFDTPRQLTTVHLLGPAGRHPLRVLPMATSSRQPPCSGLSPAAQLLPHLSVIDPDQCRGIDQSSGIPSRLPSAPTFGPLRGPPSGLGARPPVAGGSRRGVTLQNANLTRRIPAPALMDASDADSQTDSQTSANEPILKDASPRADPRTGLTWQSTQRHQLILSFLQDHSVSEFVTAVQERYPHPSTTATWLGAALGALPRAQIYGFRRSFVPADVAVIKNAIRAAKRNLRLTASVATPGIPLQTISEALQHPNLPPAHKLFLALQILTGGHRATSIENIQIRDVVDPAAMTPDFRPKPFADTPVTTPTVDLAIIFRDTKTAATIGTYALHLSVTAELAVMIKQLLRLSAQNQAHLPSHKQFLFGPSKALIRRQCGQLLPARPLRRTLLRMLCGPMGISPEDALLFSRHTTVKQLRTYLGAGVVADKDRAVTTGISALIPSMIPELL